MSENYVEFKACWSEATIAEKRRGMGLSKGQFLSHFPLLQAISLADSPAEQGCARGGWEHPTLWQRAEASESSCPTWWSALVLCSWSGSL